MSFKVGDKIVVVNHPYIPNETCLIIKNVEHGLIIPEGEYSIYNVFFKQIRKLTKLELALK